MLVIVLHVGVQTTDVLTMGCAVWSKWYVSLWDVPYKGEVMMVFMILKLERKTSNDKRGLGLVPW